MILQALCAYARDAELVEDPAFETRPVDYKLEIDESGHFIGLTPLNKRILTPRKRVDKTALGKADFLVDKASYILAQRQYFSGKAQKGKTREDDQKKNAGINLSAYRDYLRQVVDPVSTPLVALLAFLDSPEERAAADRELAILEKEFVEGAAEKKPKRGDKILVPAINGEFLHQNPSVRNAWKTYFNKDRESGEGAIGGQAICLVTGKKAPIARLHPNITGIPGSHSSGAKIVSFNEVAFNSHGQNKGTNAPVSENAALLYTAALNDLISKKREGGRKSAVQLDDHTLIAFWTREPDELTALLGEAVGEFWEEKEKETASLRERLEAYWKGRESKAGQPNAFYALTLSANQSRVVIRDWFETTSVDAADNINQWFEDLSLSAKEEFFPLKGLLQSLEASPGDKEKQKNKKKKQEDNDQSKDKDKFGLPSSLMGQIFRSLLLGMPLPSALLAKAVQRMRLPHNRKRPSDLKYRAALIKAALIRHPSLHLQRKELTVSLNPENHEPAYLLGRLFAVLERLQYEAHRDRNSQDQNSKSNDDKDKIKSTIRDRYYGAASTTPAVVFGQLLRLSMNHASKLDSKGIWLEKIKSEILNSLEAKPMPKTLRLEEQGLFALGYYQQRAKFFEKKEKDDFADASDSDAA